MTRDLVAGVDSSTQSCTVVIRALSDGAVVHTARRPHPRTSPPVSEQEPNAWWRALVAAFNDIPEPVRTRVAAISICAQAHGLVLLDAALDVIRPAKLWNDTTSAPEARRLRDILSPHEWARRTGSVPPPAFTISKLAWCAAHEPDSLGRARHLLVPGNWLVFRLTGQLCTDASNASGTGYFDPAGRQWDPELIALAVEGDAVARSATREWSSALPEVLGDDEQSGSLSVSAAGELGLAPGIPVGPGAADTQASALAMDVRSGDVVFSLGTSGVVCARSGVPIADESGRVNGNTSATGDFLPVVCTLNATRVTDAVARVLGVDLDELALLALAADTDDDRPPLLVPYFDGERVPERPEASGMLLGITAEITREQVAAAAFDGVVAGLVSGVLIMAELGVPVGGRVVVTGGGARSAAYRQSLADLTRRPVQIAELDDTAAAGAAVQAAAVLEQRTVAEQSALWAPQWAEAAVPRIRDSARHLDRFAAAAALVGPDERTA